jgi:hypothetical protein
MPRFPATAERARLPAQRRHLGLQRPDQCGLLRDRRQQFPLAGPMTPWLNTSPRAAMCGSPHYLIFTKFGTPEAHSDRDQLSQAQESGH